MVRSRTASRTRRVSTSRAIPASVNRAILAIISPAIRGTNRLVSLARAATTMARVATIWAATWAGAEVRVRTAAGAAGCTHAPAAAPAAAARVASASDR